jgi:hypothetical protein
MSKWLLSTRLFLLLLVLLLIPSGAVSIWLGTNGIVINEAEGFHFGPTATAEVTYGLAALAIGIVALLLYLAQFTKRNALIDKLSPWL